MSPFLKILRIPYEEPYTIQLVLAASNGAFAGTVDIYCDVEDLSEIGARLKAFPERYPDEWRYEYGSDDPAKPFYRHFLMSLRAMDAGNRCALQIAMNRNENGVEDALCRFSLIAEMNAVNQLGRLFEAFARLEHLELAWTPTGGQLHEQYQDVPEERDWHTFAT